MERPLRALIVDDSERDSELLVRELGRGGFSVSSQRVETAEALRVALAKQGWDVVFCDHSMPHFDSARALSVVRESGLDLPFIIVSGTVGEDVAVEAMRSGAQDYFRKDKLSPRIVPAVERELREALARRARRQAEEALREKEAQYRQLVESVRAVVWRADARTFRFTLVSPEAEKILGYPLPMWLQPDFWRDHVHPDDREWVLTLCRKNTEARRDHEFEYRMVKADGGVVWFRDIVRVVVEDGEPRELLGVMIDVSEERRLEGQLRQAQKMEAIGELAGGIAHDFNNLLGVITGYCDLLENDVRQGERGRLRLEQIRKAAGRASSLTRQLLAFSRKQVLQPRVLDLSGVVAEIEGMLRRLIGEDVELITACASDLGRVRVDPGQVEQVVFNLALNARDAMPRGGRLVIETANVDIDDSEARTHPDARPGPHVMLAVSDSGHGMDAGTLARIFEPFFTTKEPGRGTGLGLSTVYGVVKQSGGHITANSEVGKGSTFRIYLPRIEDAAEDDAGGRVAEERPGGPETILLLEDDGALRLIIREILETAGYRLLDCASPEEALSAAASHGGPIDLMLTDVVMPRMDGRQVVERMEAIRPRTRVLYMSGYPGKVVDDHLVLGPAVEFIAKPFTAQTILQRVREILDRPGA